MHYYYVTLLFLPLNAGTKYNAFLVFPRVLKQCLVVLMLKHRSVHSMAFPAEAIGPSNANTGLVSKWYAIVVSKPFSENTLFSPVTVNTVPLASNVAFVMPRRKHRWPTRAAWRFPITPVIGTLFRGPSEIKPYIWELVRISAKLPWSISKNFNRFGSHCNVLMFIKNVLDAFVVSVANTPSILP